jgi:hypothetical protein
MRRGIVYGRGSGIQTFVCATQGKHAVLVGVVSMCGMQYYVTAASRIKLLNQIVWLSAVLSETNGEVFWLRKLHPLLGSPNCPVDVGCDNDNNNNTAERALADQMRGTFHHRSPSIFLLCGLLLLL